MSQKILIFNSKCEQYDLLNSFDQTLT